MKIRWKPLLIQFAISLGVAGLSALSTMNSMELYQSLNRPPLSPPGWLFGVVWTILFVLMGLSAYLVWIMIIAFMKVSFPAAMLQIPYLLWVTFAGYLSLFVALLN